jgi:ABC-2 type transport system ATP-binding protein
MTAQAIRLTGVTKRFGTMTAVNGVTLSIPGGSVYGLIGPNGAGKTTTFSMLAGFLRPTAGSVEVLGFAPSAVDALRGRLGVLPQDAVLPATDTAGELLVHLARLQGLPHDKALEAAHVALDEVAGGAWWAQRCGSLSHGMAKRVALAQAFLGDPEVVLLDEPTAGLDPRVAWEMRQLIKAKTGAGPDGAPNRGARARQRTILISSHNLQELEEICDAAAILDRGRLVASGTIAELTASTEEVHFHVTPPREPPGAKIPLDAVRAIPVVKLAEYDDIRNELAVHFDRDKADAEGIIDAVLRVLLEHRVRISGVSKGRGLEQRVMDLT